MEIIDTSIKTTLKTIIKGSIAATKSNIGALNTTQKTTMIVGGVLEYAMLARLAYKRDSKAALAYGATLVATNTAYYITGCYKAISNNKTNALKAFVDAAEDTIKNDTGANNVVILTTL